MRLYWRIDCVGALRYRVQFFNAYADNNMQRILCQHSNYRMDNLRESDSLLFSLIFITKISVCIENISLKVKYRHRGHKFVQ